VIDCACQSPWNLLQFRPCHYRSELVCRWVIVGALSFRLSKLPRGIESRPFCICAVTFDGCQRPHQKRQLRCFACFWSSVNAGFVPSTRRLSIKEYQSRIRIQNLIVDYQSGLGFSLRESGCVDDNEMRTTKSVTRMENRTMANIEQRLLGEGMQ